MGVHPAVSNSVHHHVEHSSVLPTPTRETWLPPSVTMSLCRVHWAVGLGDTVEWVQRMGHADATARQEECLERCRNDGN